MNAVEEAMRRAVRQYAERELDKQNHDYLERFRRESLQEKSFYNLTEEDLRKMREVVVRLAQKLKNIISMRKKRRAQGQVRPQDDHAPQHGPRRHPVRADLQASPQGSAQARRAL